MTTQLTDHTSTPSRRAGTRATHHRVLAGLSALGVAGYGSGAVIAAIQTHAEMAAATLADDTSLYGLGYVVAALLGAAALVVAVVAGLGWWLAGRRPDAGAAVLTVAAVLAAFPVLASLRFFI
jgi:hypothetical protein